MNNQRKEGKLIRWWTSAVHISALLLPPLPPPVSTKYSSRADLLLDQILQIVFTVFEQQNVYYLFPPLPPLLPSPPPPLTSPSSLNSDIFKAIKGRGFTVSWFSASHDKEVNDFGGEIEGDVFGIFLEYIHNIVISKTGSRHCPGEDHDSAPRERI